MSQTMSETVQLFVTCIIDAVFPQVGRDVVEELERNGAEVEFPADQTCCGQPAYNAGHHRESTEVLAHNLEVLDRTGGPIVIPSGSCADFLIHHGPRLASGDPEKAAMAERVAARIREFTSFVAEQRERASAEETETQDRSPARRAFYHPSCHALRGLGLRREGESLLESVRGVERVEIEGAEECCGFGGLFALEMPEVSTGIMNTKLDRLEEAGVEMLVGGDAACLIHLEGGLRRRENPMQVVHIASAIAPRRKNLR
ncbi:MAG: (Fe-S)-binding protein [Acidimicrobiia bacterium]|nr:(Fe-S)-binding protein [Acidimicrobiia bacterium]